MDRARVCYFSIVFVAMAKELSAVYLSEGLYWTGDSNQIYVQNGTANWVNHQTLPENKFLTIGHSFQRYIGMSYDYRRNYILMSDKGAKTISLVGKDVDGTLRGAFVHVGTSANVGHVAVDWLSGNVYWADSVFGWIGLQALSDNIRSIKFNDKFKAVVDKYLDIPSGIAVHPQKRFLFWSDIGKPARIERSNLDGSSRMVLIWLGIIRPISLTVDHANNIIYWVDSIRSTVESCDFYGNNRKVLVTSFTSQFYGLAVFENYIIVSDQAKKEIAVHSPNGDPVPNPVKTPNVPYSISMFSINNQPLASESCSSKGCDDICITTVTGAKCACKDGYKLDQDGLKCIVDTHALDKSYLIGNASKLCAYPITTINSHPYLKMTPNCDIATIDDIQEIDFIASETSAKSLFIASKKSQLIYRQKLSGTHHRIYEGKNYIKGLFYDWTTSELYWTEANNADIYKSFVGTNSSFKIDNSTRGLFRSNLDSPRAITLDPLGRKIFWIVGTQDIVIQTASLDELSGDVTLVQTGLSLPHTLTFSRRLNRLFWTDIGKIGRVAPDGTDTHINNVPNTFVYSGITTYKDYVLWLSRNSSGVYMNVEDLSDMTTPKQDMFKLSDIPHATEVQIFDKGVQPEIIEPCINKNGGCEHICIAEDFSSHCKCELGYKLHSDGKSCTVEPLQQNYFLAIDDLASRIYQIEKETGNAVAVNIDKSNVPSAVTLDDVSQKIVWCDSRVSKLKISNINGTEEKTLTTNGLGVNSRLAVDQATGNIFFTKGNAIAVASQDGKLQKNIVEGLQNVLAISLYSKNGKMFWSEIGTSPSIKQSNMDGSSVVTLVESKPDKILSPKDITVDIEGNALIWCDDNLDKIERIDLTSHESTNLRSNAKEYPIAIAIDEKYVYYIGNGRRTIIRIDKNDGKGAQNVVSSPLYGKLTSLFISRNSVSKHDLCAEKNGFCSRICLPKGKEKTCACPNGVDLKEDGRTCVGDIICPNEFKHGTIKTSCLRYEGHVCGYSCTEDGYFSNTSLTKVTCKSNGFWNVDTDTLCLKVTCSGDVVNGEIDKQCGRLFGESCNFKCNDGLKTERDSERLTCQSDGNWDSDVATLCTVPGIDGALSTVAVIGIAVGSVIVVIIIVVVIILCLMNKVRKERKDNHNPPPIFFTHDMHTKILSESQRSNVSYYSTPNANDDQESVYHELDASPIQINVENASERRKDDGLGSSKTSERYSVFPRTDNKNVNYLELNADSHIHLAVEAKNNKSEYLEFRADNSTPHVYRKHGQDNTYLHATIETRPNSSVPEPDYD